MQLSVIGDDDGSLCSAIEQAQRTGLVGEGVTLVGVSTSMLGCGAGIPLPEPVDPVCSGSPWVPLPQDTQENE